MAEALKLYEYEVGGITHTAQLSAEDAERYGAKEVKGAKAPANKSRQAPANKGTGA